MFCTQCGNAITIGSKFCNACGARASDFPLSKEESSRFDDPNDQATSNAITSDWYESLTDGQRNLLWIVSIVFVFVYGIGLIPLTFLLFKSLGQSHSNGFYSAGFRKFVLGADVRNLTSNEQRRAGVRSGVVVSGVIYESPAFDSGIVPGDIILTINGEPVHTTLVHSNLLQRFVGQRATISLIRDGQNDNIEVQLNG